MKRLTGPIADIVDLCLPKWRAWVGLDDRAGLFQLIVAGGVPARHRAAQL